MKSTPRTLVKFLAAPVCLGLAIFGAPIAGVHAEPMGAFVTLQRMSPEPAIAPAVPAPVEALKVRNPLLNELNKEIEGLYKTVSPSAVTIWITQQGTPSKLFVARPGDQDGRFAFNVVKMKKARPDNPYDPYEFRAEDQDAAGDPNAVHVVGAGSGFILSANGLVATNRHVAIEGTKPNRGLIAQLSDGTKVPAEIVRIDKDNDLAIILIHAKSPLTPAKLGDSDALQVGESVFALGAPLGLPNNFTWGTVTGLRDVPTEEGSNKTQRLIHIDAVINPGNSGGPLFNVQGQVVGINTMILSETGAFSGNGLAIPINDLKDFLRSTTPSARQGGARTK